ncbi:MAG TPA: SAM-dependent methyltransferase [Phycisphaerae bacterium]|nr:SAM-dependent methyltransferase [Phycisphaerae bacterium]
MPTWRTRLAVGLISAAVIGLELALMRALSVRFWHHFAYMVISVALLGFGTSGTALMLLRRQVVGRARGWLCALALAFSVSAVGSLWAAGKVPLNVRFLAWDFSQVGYVAVLELVLFVPFLLGGAVVGVALMDRPERIGGHYAANLIGSGLGAVSAVVLMYVLSGTELVLAMALVAYVGGAWLVPWRRVWWASAALGIGAAAVAVAALAPLEPTMSQYKMLSQVRAMPGVEVIYETEGPLGRIDVVAGPAIHYATGLSLQYTASVPPHVLLITDGDQTSPVYDCRSPRRLAPGERRGEWRFLDYTTAALAYHLQKQSAVLVIGAGGGADLGLALFHGSPRIVGLEMNPQIIEVMTGPLASYGGDVYDAPGVRVVNQEARGYLASTGELFDIIQLPPIDAFGASGAGVYAAQESYLYTVESFAAMLDRLSDNGVLCVTRWARTPPREGLKVLDTAAEALRQKGLEPAQRLVMIRSWATVTVLVSKRPLGAEAARRIRAFADERGFDLCWLPGLTASEVNRYHVLDRPYYFEAARAMLGADRDAYLAAYPFEVTAPTDDRPYFFHAFRWRSLRLLREQLGRRSRAYLEVGYLMLLAALGQAVLLAAVMIVLPLALGVKALGSAPRKAASLGYFLLLGAGFMLLEMGFLQKLILYLAHPIYSSAAVIGGFLLFGGLGSLASGRRRGRIERVGAVAAAAVVCLGLGCVFGLGRWLALTQAAPVALRFLVAWGTIAPLAFAMGHMFPTGLRLVGTAAPAIVPWAWAVNGFASVVATVSAPLLAMEFGFSRLMLIAVGCYLLAGVLVLRLGARRQRRFRPGP